MAGRRKKRERARDKFEDVSIFLSAEPTFFGWGADFVVPCAAAAAAAAEEAVVVVALLWV